MSKWLAVVFLLAAPTAFADPLLQAPSDVQGHYDAVADSFVLSWLDSEGATFRVYRDGTLLGTVTEPTFQDANLPDALSWTYQVTMQEEGAESAPATLFVVRPNDASNLGSGEGMEVPGPNGPIAKTHGPVVPGGLPEYCTITTLGWGPDPPYAFSVDEDCLRDLIGP